MHLLTAKWSLIPAWERLGGRRCPELTNATKELSFVLLSRNVQLSLTHVLSRENPTDGPSRRLSSLDSRLTNEAWERIEKVFGGPGGHSFDLLALDSNVMLPRNGTPLPHFSPHPSPQSAGGNLFAQNRLEFEDMSNPYVFPPFGLAGPVLRFKSLQIASHLRFIFSPGIKPSSSPCFSQQIGLLIC